MKWLELAVKWIYENRAWLFEGLGLAFITGVIIYFQRKKRGGGGNTNKQEPLIKIDKSIGKKAKATWFGKVNIKVKDK